MSGWIRLNRWWFAFVALIVLGAIFIDTYSLTYHHLINRSHPNATPTIAGREITVREGLDIKGGTELTIAICKGFNNPPGTNCRAGVPGGNSAANLAKAQQGTITVLEQRVNGLGVSEATVQAQGNDQVLVQLPGVPIQKAIATVGTTAALHFATAVANTNNSPAPDPKDPKFLEDQQNLFEQSQLASTNYYPTGYHWKIDNAIKASNVTSAQAAFSNSGSTTGWVVQISFDSAGASEWEKITTAANAFYSPTALVQAPQSRVAIFLDNVVLTAPTVVSPSSNQTEISGNFDQQSSTTLAQQISAGALPAQISPVASTSVSATLGQDTIRKSLIAGAVGFLIVILFMVSYYRFPGALASAALLAYAAIVFAFYMLIPVTLTLAGLAGFVLSVGMAVDANVLIFERIRDELRHGRSTAIAVETGFRRAFPAIRDSNVSTIIACAVLYYFGSSVVKGFALTLGLGVAVSFFTALLVTQSLLHLALRLRWGRRAALYTEIREDYAERPPQGRFDIVRSRNAFFAGSLAIIIPGILAILVWGFRLGIDFQGGNDITVQLRTHATQAQVLGTVNGVAQSLRPEVQGQSNNTFSIRTLPSSIDRVTAITTALDKKYGFATVSGKQQVQVQTVGPTIASDLVQKAIILVLVASLLIALYLAYVFGRQKVISPLRFSVSTFLKLLHDVFVLAGIWAIIGHFNPIAQVDSLFITALLTAVAFSIHDTIVVFDRIRENLKLGQRLGFKQIVNLSTVQTMTRSLNTSLTVVFVLTALVLFGGDSIRGFVLALLIGIVTGTYSSIFNASTLLVAWQTAEEARPSKAGGPQRRIHARAGV